MLKESSAARGFGYAIALAACVIAGNAHSQQLNIGSGARFSLGTSTLDVGCRNLDVVGTLDIGAGQVRKARNVTASGSVRGGTGILSVNGDLAAAGALVPENGTVAIGDFCDPGATRITGDHAFNNLQVSITNDHTLILPANGTQTIAQSLVLQGGISRLVMQSSVFGAVGFLALAQAGSQFVNRVDAIDVGAPPTAQFLAPQPAASYDSIDRGNTPRFFGDFPVVPVPTLSWAGVFSMLLLLGAIGARQLSARGA